MAEILADGQGRRCDAARQEFVENCEQIEALAVVFGSCVIGEARDFSAQVAIVKCSPQYGTFQVGARHLPESRGWSRMGRP